MAYDTSGLKAEIERLRERVRNLQSVLDGLDGKGDAWARTEAQRLRNEISGIKSEIADLQSKLR